MPPRPSVLSSQRLAFYTRPVVPRKRVAPVQKCFASTDAPNPPTEKTSQPPLKASTRASISAADQRILAQYGSTPPPPPEPEVQFQGTRVEGLPYPQAGPGHKFALPDTSALKITDHLRRRYDPVIDQVTKSIMRDGKLSVAQKNVSLILDYLRTAPAPHASGASYRPLLSDTMLNTEHTHTVAVPREQLPLSPIQYLTAAIDSVAPLVKIRQQKGMAGGGASTPIPVPLRVKQRRRTAIQWILQAAESRKETRLAERLAKEIIKVADGTSSAWEKRQQVHRLAVVARSNIRLTMRRKRSYLAYARRHGVSPSSPTFLGTRYEYVVSDTVRRLSIDTVRVGQAGDRGVDLVGFWHLPSEQQHQTPPIRVVVQCKRLAKKVTPSVVRELEGSFAAGHGGVRSDATAPVLGIVVGTTAATKGVVDGLKRAGRALVWLCVDEVDADAKQPDEYGLKAGRIRQVLWNHRASALGLEGVDVVKRHYTSPHQQERGDEVELHWRGRRIDDALLPSRDDPV
ncbi:hypothetical protein DV735_g3357, partial [Chaetothyriales sp. CBS 134920]